MFPVVTAGAGVVWTCRNNLAICGVPHVWVWVDYVIMVGRFEIF